MSSDVGDGDDEATPATAVAHPSLGAPGDRVDYVPRALFGAEERKNARVSPIRVRVPGAEIPTIFAHRQWHAGMLLGDLIFGQHLDLKGKIVLEFGAGTGVPSIAARRFGQASFVLSTDYDSPPLVATLRENVRASCVQEYGKSIRVMGHTWGRRIDDVGEQVPASFRTEHFDVVLLADCIWDNLSHSALLQSISKLLARNKEARVYLASGLHTGRDTVTAFLRRAYKAGLHAVPLRDATDNTDWPTLDVLGREEQTATLASLRVAGDDALLSAAQHIYELELKPVSTEDDIGVPLDPQHPSGARLYTANHRRLTGRRRAFVIDECPEERKENNGVHLRNRWMTLTALAWRNF